MKTDYADKQYLKDLQRENKLESLRKLGLTVLPYIAGTLAGIGLIYGLTCTAPKMISTYVSKAESKLIEQLDKERKENLWIYNSGANPPAQRR